MMNRLKSTLMMFAVTALAAEGCAIDKTTVPELSGPSELSLSLALSAQPSTLSQDGVSQSAIGIVARDANGQPARSIVMRAEILIGGAVFDFGRLSTKAPVTDQSGHATVMYTAPPLATDPVDNHAVVTILVTPETGDNRSALARQIDIRLVPPGVVLPPNGAPVPNFTFSPSTPSTFSSVHFDASTSADDGAIVSYAWNFGDGTSGTGVQVSHEYELGGVYNVILTVTDDRGLSASTAPVAVSVTQSAGPTALFTFSPLAPLVDDQVFFNASGSTASPGHEIVSYKWNFGTSNGNSASGVTVSKKFGEPGSYTVTLVVRDDADQEGTLSQQVQVGQTGTGPGPKASFTFSPLQPAISALVHFDAASSTPLSTIVSFAWDFGDGGSGSGVQPTHRYDTAGTFTVTLLVRDSDGNTDSTSLIVPVGSPAPSASFTFSPGQPTTGATVFFNASSSTSSSGTSLVSFAWDFGDGNPGSGVTPSHVFNAEGTFAVTLTVTDSVGQSNSTSRSITVNSLSADFTISPPNPTVTLAIPSVLVSVVATIQNATGTVTYSWDFTGGAPNTGIGPSASTTYTAGTYVITLTVSDDVSTVVVPKQITVTLVP